MYFVLEPDQFDHFPKLMTQMFRLRARVFRDELGWVDTPGDEERDIYDDCAPTYIMCTDETATHLYAAARLMPTMGPTLLADVFSDTCPDVDLQSPSTWEITRLAADDALMRSHGLGRQRMTIMRDFFLAGMEFGAANGIDGYVANFDDARLRFWNRLGARFDLLGTSDKFSVTVHLGLIDSTPEALAEVRAKLGVHGTLLSPTPTPSRMRYRPRRGDQAAYSMAAA